jgi:hypothetical protein
MNEVAINDPAMIDKTEVSMLHNFQRSVIESVTHRPVIHARRTVKIDLGRGCGKTFILLEISKALVQKGYDVRFLCPSSRTAERFVAAGAKPFSAQSTTDKTVLLMDDHEHLKYDPSAIVLKAGGFCVHTSSVPPTSLGEEGVTRFGVAQ